MRAETVLSFGLPDGRLDLRGADLDRWAEHLTWCCRLMCVPEGATIGVVDFGTSPVAFLGSRLLTPMLTAGLAELLPGRVICLDASRERVALVPSILKQVRLDALFVREEAVPALVTYCREADQPLDDILVITVAGLGQREDAHRFRRGRRLLLEERAMLMAPECAHCGQTHLRASHYELSPEGDVVTRGSGVVTWLPDTLQPGAPGCPASPQDLMIPPAIDTRPAWA